MEKNAHFAIVGAFLILSLILGVVFLLWLTEAKQATKTSRYEIRFEGSVSGLDLGGDVSYLGVKIGNICIQCDETDDGQTGAEITYIYTGLSEEGNAAIEKLDKATYRAYIAYWERAINHYLSTGKILIEE